MEMETKMRATRLLTPPLPCIRPSAWGSRMAGEGPGEEGLGTARQDWVVRGGCFGVHQVEVAWLDSHSGLVTLKTQVGTL